VRPDRRKRGINMAERRPQTDSADEAPESTTPPAPTSADEATSSDPMVERGLAEERVPSSASGLTADDPDDGEQRKELYRRGATLVSRID
jgi:hypothetical protein